MVEKKKVTKKEKEKIISDVLKNTPNKYPKLTKAMADGMAQDIDFSIKRHKILHKALGIK
jgi:hypothetical protein